VWRAWLAVALLFVVGFLNYLDRNMLLTMRPSVVNAIPMTEAQFGLLTSVFLWVYAALSPIAGFLADRFSRSRVIVISLFVWSAVTWLTAHARTYEELLCARALMGISEAFYLPAAVAVIIEYHRGPTRSLATGVHLAGVMAGQGMGWIGGLLAENGDWTHPFAVFGVVGIVYSFVLLALLRDPPRETFAVTLPTGTVEKVSFVAALKSLFGNGSFILLLSFFGLLGIAGWGIVGWLPTYFQEHFHLTQTQAGKNATIYLNIASFTGIIAGGALSDLWSRTNSRGRILLPAIGLCLAAGGALILAMTQSMQFAIVGVMIYGLTRTSADANLMPILALIADPRYRATGYGLLNMLSCIIGGLSVYAGGALRDAHIDLSKLFMVMVGVILVCAVILVLIKPKPELAK